MNQDSRGTVSWLWEFASPHKGGCTDSSFVPRDFHSLVSQSYICGNIRDQSEAYKKLTVLPMGYLLDTPPGETEKHIG